MSSHLRGAASERASPPLLKPREVPSTCCAPMRLASIPAGQTVLGCVALVVRADRRPSVAAWRRSRGTGCATHPSTKAPKHAHLRWACKCADASSHGALPGSVHAAANPLRLGRVPRYCRGGGRRGRRRGAARAAEGRPECSDHVGAAVRQQRAAPGQHHWLRAVCRRLQQVRAAHAPWCEGCLTTKGCDHKTPIRTSFLSEIQPVLPTISGAKVRRGARRPLQ